MKMPAPVAAAPKDTFNAAYAVQDAAPFVASAPPPPPKEQIMIRGTGKPAEVPSTAAYGSGFINTDKSRVNDTIYIGRRTQGLTLQKQSDTDDVTSKLQGKVAGVESKYPSRHEAYDLRLISGKVLDATTGELMGGAVVHERSTNKRVLTDSAGNFSFTVNARARASIDVSMIGYKPTVVNVPLDKSNLDIYLPASENGLSEVVIVTGSKGRAVPHPAIGHAAYDQYLNALPPVPVEALPTAVSGEVRVTFTVKEDSTLTDIRAIKPFHPAAGAIAVKRVQEGPKWAPVKGRNRKGEIRVPVKLIPSHKKDRQNAGLPSISSNKNVLFLSFLPELVE